MGREKASSVQRGPVRLDGNRAEKTSRVSRSAIVAVGQTALSGMSASSAHVMMRRDTTILERSSHAAGFLLLYSGPASGDSVVRETHRRFSNLSRGKEFP